MITTDDNYFTNDNKYQETFIIVFWKIFIHGKKEKEKIACWK